MAKAKEWALFVTGVVLGVFVVTRIIEWKLRGVYRGL